MAGEGVGVVVPAYNAERFLAATLDGILSQTEPVAECVVVDDGSTDETAAVARSAGGPVRIVRQENRGVSAARNRGMAELSASWTAFCDADDVWLPRKLERQLAALRRAPDAAAALTGAVRVGPDGAELARQDAEPDPGEITLCGLVHHRPGAVPTAIASSLLASREVLAEVGPWDESLGDAADWEYLIRLRQRGPFAGTTKPLVHYRQHPSAMSADVAGRARDVRRLFRKLRRDPALRRECGKELPSAWAWQTTVMAASYWRAGRPVAGLGLLARELLRHPVSVSRALLERVRA